MRDPERIELICKQLKRTWELDPDMRLGQLIVNAIQPREPCPAIFYTEDKTTWAGLERMSRRGQPPSQILSELDPQEIRWTPCTPPPSPTVLLDGVSEGDFHFAFQPLGSEEESETFATLLELSFVGEYARGSAGKGAAAAMLAAAAPWLLSVQPDVVLLDLSRVHYEWGNNLLDIARAIDGLDPLNPISSVWLGGPNSIAGLRSLLDDVHDSRDAAIASALDLGCRHAVRVG